MIKVQISGAIYYNVLKHEWSLSVMYLTLSLSSYWPPLYL